MVCYNEKKFSVMGKSGNSKQKKVHVRQIMKFLEERTVTDKNCSPFCI